MTQLGNRFWSKVAPPDARGCRRWCGVHVDSYGQFRVGKTMEYAHRLSLAEALGRPLTGKALHTCDVKDCVEPGHLYEGSSKDNARDAIERGLLPGGPRKIEREQAEWIRTRYADGSGWWTRLRLAQRFSVSEATISAIVKGRTHRTAGGPISPPRGGYGVALRAA